MLEQRFARIFFAGSIFLIAILTSLLPLIETSFLRSFADFFGKLSGIKAFANESRFPEAAATGVGISLGWALATFFVFPTSQLNHKEANRKLENLSFSSKILYFFVLILVSIGPWIFELTSSEGRLLSAELFAQVVNSSIAFGLFCAGVYACTAAAFFFILLLFKK